MDSLVPGLDNSRIIQGVPLDNGEVLLKLHFFPNQALRNQISGAKI